MAGMSLTFLERAYLTGHRIGMLATVAPSGAVHNKPVGFHYNADLGTVDVAGYGMESSAKFRNIQAHPEVSFMVEDTVDESADAAGVRFLEIRGRAVAASAPARDGLSDRIIRIHPTRAVGWNVDADHPGPYARDVATVMAP